jgi:hypothetical protein
LRAPCAIAPTSARSAIRTAAVAATRRVS